MILMPVSVHKIPEKPIRLTPPEVPFEIRFGISMKELERRLKQKRATISSYARFLRENGLKANLSTLDLYISSLTGRL